MASEWLVRAHCHAPAIPPSHRSRAGGRAPLLTTTAADLSDGRHPKPEVVEQILALFGRYYLPNADEEGAPADPPAASQIGAVA